MLKDHPMIERIEMQGYATQERSIGIDALGNEVFEGDEIFTFEDEFFLVDELDHKEMEILSIVGADRTTV